MEDLLGGLVLCSLFRALGLDLVRRSATPRPILISGLGEGRYNPSMIWQRDRGCYLMSVRRIGVNRTEFFDWMPGCRAIRRLDLGERECVDDLRLVEWGGRMYGIGCHHTPMPDMAPTFAWPTVAVVEVDRDADKLQTAMYVHPFPARRWPQKNWVPISGTPFVVTDLVPKVVVGRMDYAAPSWTLESETEWPPGVKVPSKLRNTTNFLPFDENRIFALAHVRESHYLYTYYWILLGREFPWRPLALSKPFVLYRDRQFRRYEFAPSLVAESGSPGTFLLGVGVGDYASAWKRVSLRDIVEQFDAGVFGIVEDRPSRLSGKEARMHNDFGGVVDVRGV